MKMVGTWDFYKNFTRIHICQSRKLLCILMRYVLRTIFIRNSLADLFVSVLKKCVKAGFALIVEKPPSPFYCCVTD